MEKERKNEFETFATHKPELTVLTDHPLTDTQTKDFFELDPFNFRFKLGPVFDILRHPDTKTPTAILISGGWGTGKTSAMKWLDTLLTEWKNNAGRKDVKVRSVWFYPWKYDNKEDVRRGIISEVIINATYVRDPETKELKIDAKKLKEGLKTMGLFAFKAAKDFATSLKIGLPGIGKLDGAFIDKIMEDYKEAAHPEKAFFQEYEAALKKWVEKSLGKNERLVIFIDDLDRCMPDIALQVLEALKLYLNIQNLVFVLGVDKQVVENLVVEYYKKLGLVKKKEVNESDLEKDKRKKAELKAKQYLSKMFQAEIEISPNEKQIIHFFDEQLKEITYWKEDYLSKIEQNIFRELILKLAERNPREVKRLLNSSLITGAGAVLLKDKIEFRQGMQLFFVRKILDERYSMTLIAGSKRGTDFFVQWSRIICESIKKDKNFPITVKVPTDFGKEPQSELDIEEKTKKRLENVFASFAPDEYHDLLKNPKFSGLLKLLADEDLGQLMKIPYPSEALEILAVDEINISDFVKATIARKLNKKPEDIISDDYTRVTELDLSNSNISDLEPIKGLIKLRELFLHYTSVSNLEPLKNLTNLIRFGVNNTLVSDLKPLTNLTDLQALDLDSTQVSDLTPLKDLNSLQRLYLRNTKVSDINPLAGIINLQVLFLHHTSISNLEPLKNLTKLIRLGINNTPVYDLKPLSNLTNIQALDLSNTEVSDLESLKNLNSLQRLYLNGTQISDLEPIKGISNLQTLYIDETPVSNLDPLKGMKSLETLKLQNTKVTDLEPIGYLKSIKALDLSSTQISNLDPVKTLTKIELLTFSYTKVVDLEPIKQLTHLRSLSFSNTQVTNLEPIKGLTKLKDLYMFGTKVSDISPIASLINIELLDLRNTQIKDVKPLEKLVKLQGINLYNTPVTDISPLKALKNLTTLNLVECKNVTNKQVEDLKKALPGLGIHR